MNPIFFIIILIILPKIIISTNYLIRRYINKYQWYGYNYTRYSPAIDINPFELSYFLNRKVEDSAFSASIIYFFQKGYLNLEKVNDEFFIKRTINLEDLFELDSPIDILIILYFFSDISLNKIPNEITYEVLSEGGFLKNIYLEKPVSFSKNKEKKKDLFLIESVIKNKFIEDGLFKKKNLFVLDLKTITYILTIGTFTTLFVAFAYFFEFTFKGVFVLPFLVPFAFIIGNIPLFHYTKKGWEIKGSFEGFRTFLSKTEKDRYVFSENLSKEDILFRKYLPYSIVFGLNKEWLKEI